MSVITGVSLRERAQQEYERDQDKRQADLLARAKAAAGRLFPGIALGDPDLWNKWGGRELPVWLNVDGISMSWIEYKDRHGSQHRDFHVVEQCAQCNEIQTYGPFASLAELGELLQNEDEWECPECNKKEEETEREESASRQLAELSAMLSGLVRRAGVDA